MLHRGACCPFENIGRLVSLAVTVRLQPTTQGNKSLAGVLATHSF